MMTLLNIAADEELDNVPALHSEFLRLKKAEKKEAADEVLKYASSAGNLNCAKYAVENGASNFDDALLWACYENRNMPTDYTIEWLLNNHLDSISIDMMHRCLNTRAMYADNEELLEKALLKKQAV